MKTILFTLILLCSIILVEKSGKAMVEVWANFESGTFTVIRVVHLPVGKAICATIHGEAFYKIEEENKPKIPGKIKEKKT